ncbi:hypothetical protein B9Z55_025260 [Caenorhabditis nigoni]|uniref:Uncharacterized protein n=1 Tax=Caenorhabditis nigoni TaxID=1611254 RepID=A0A2G5SXX7_9PELO|nr:hypothetical protein B9Z55_025260 [Caenorhabditis nigoni]
MIAVPRLNGLLKTNSDVLHEILEMHSFEHNADRNFAINQMSLDDVQVKQQLDEKCVQYMKWNSTKVVLVPTTLSVLNTARSIVGSTRNLRNFARQQSFEIIDFYQIRIKVHIGVEMFEASFRSAEIFCNFLFVYHNFRNFRLISSAKNRKTFYLVTETSKSLHGPPIQISADVDLVIARFLDGTTQADIGTALVGRFTEY